MFWSNSLRRRSPDPQPGSLESIDLTTSDPQLLREFLKDAVQLHAPVIVIGPPGVGKTYQAELVAREAQRDGLIRDYRIITGRKSLTPEDLFEARLMTTKTPPFIDFKPSMFRSFLHPDSLVPASGRTLEEAQEHWDRMTEAGNCPWFLLVLDEVTRMSTVTLEALFDLLNGFRVEIEGESYFVPVCVILLGNPAGMDSGTAAFSHAFTSRLFGRMTMTQPEPATLCDVYAIGHVHTDAQRMKIRETAIPTRHHGQAACIVLTLAWGLPLHRRGMSALSNRSLDVIRRAAKRPQLADIMQRLGPLFDFGPDPRKGRRWLTQAMIAANRVGETFDYSHLISTAAQCLGVGGKDTFSEGQQPEKQREKEALLMELARRAFAMSDLHDLLGPLVELDSLVDALAPGLTRAGNSAHDTAEKLSSMLAAFRNRVEADDAADRERRIARTVRVCAALPEIDLAQPAAELRAVGRLAGHAGLLDRDGDWVCSYARDLLVELASLGAETAMGKALAHGMSGARLTIHEEVRRATRPHGSLPAAIDALERTLAGHPESRGDDVITRVAQSITALSRLARHESHEPVLRRLLDTGGSQRRFVVDALGHALEATNGRLHSLIERLHRELQQR